MPTSPKVGAFSVLFLLKLLASRMFVSSSINQTIRASRTWTLCFLLLLLCSPKMMDRFDCIVVLSTIGDVCIEYRISIPGLDKLISPPRAAIRRKSYRGCGLRPGTNQMPVCCSCYQPIRGQLQVMLPNILYKTILSAASQVYIIVNNDSL